MIFRVFILSISLFGTLLAKAQREVSAVDSVRFKIYLADGFSNNRVSIEVNGEAVLTDVVLNSNPNYGLTGQEITICFKQYKWRKRSFVQTSQGVYSIKSKRKTVIKLHSDLPEFEYVIKKDKKYFVIYRRAGEYAVSTFIDQPGFD